MTDHRTQEISLRTGLGLTRRELLIGLAALGITACVPRGTGRGGAAFFGVRDPDPLPDVPDGLFALGVACGDPTPDGFVLWTRLAPEPVADAGGMPDRNVSVRWQIAEDPDFQLLAADGVVQTSSAVAHSVHVDVSGLEPDREYWYRFTTGGQVSTVGRARTAPACGRAAAPLAGRQRRFANHPLVERLIRTGPSGIPCLSCDLADRPLHPTDRRPPHRRLLHRRNRDRGPDIHLPCTHAEA